MKHDAKLAHQNLQKLLLIRDIDVLTIRFSSGGSGVRVNVFVCLRATCRQVNPNTTRGFSAGIFLHYADWPSELGEMCSSGVLRFRSLSGRVAAP